MSDVAEGLPPPLCSASAYRAAFEEALARMLDAPVLGAYVLALANAGFEPELQRRFADALRTRFEHWCGQFDAAAPEAVDAAADDRAVFDGLRRCGFDALGLTRWRQVGDWWLQFNPLRAFRPPRASHVTVDSLHRPFDPSAFHFDKPFLRPEILWEGRWARHRLRLLLNKFPFASGHLLLVPEPGLGLPQWLAEPWHSLVWELAQQAGRRLPGVGFGYNALGAFASINHLHFQQFVAPDRIYPIELPCWQHNAGDRRYPLDVECFDDSGHAWQALQRLQSANQGFNLLYRPGRLYLVRRALQGSHRISDWTSGFAWSEVAGAITVADRRVFAELGEPQIIAEFARLRAPAPG